MGAILLSPTVYIKILVYLKELAVTVTLVDSAQKEDEIWAFFHTLVAL